MAHRALLTRTQVDHLLDPLRTCAVQTQVWTEGGGPPNYDGRKALEMYKQSLESIQAQYADAAEVKTARQKALRKLTEAATNITMLIDDAASRPARGIAGPPAGLPLAEQEELIVKLRSTDHIFQNA